LKFFQKRVSSTRGDDLKLFNKRVKLDVVKFSFQFVTGVTGCSSGLSMWKG